MILTKAVEHPYRNYEDPDWNVDVRFGVKCFRVCSMYNLLFFHFIRGERLRISFSTS